MNIAFYHCFSSHSIIFNLVNLIRSFRVTLKIHWSKHIVHPTLHVNI